MNKTTMPRDESSEKSVVIVNEIVFCQNAMSIGLLSYHQKNNVIKIAIANLNKLKF